MKFNQWTLGLAAVGAVSLASVVNAEEAKLSTLNTALSNTVISGYVDAGVQWNLGNANSFANPAYGVGGADAISVNNVTVSLDKPLDESPWASGYHVDLNYGSSKIVAVDNYIRQAYVALRTPVGNGIDWKVGAVDGITGYEGNTAYMNPNYTRSYGYNLNPASYAAVLGTYKVNDIVSATAGLANGFSNVNTLSSKDYIASVALTAPKSCGFMSGSTLNLQTIQTFGNGVNFYSVNGTFNTPIAALKLGLAYDKTESLAAAAADGNIYGAYVTYQATDKLNFALRTEYVDGQNLGTPGFGFGAGKGKGEEITATVSYDLWANVVSRAEFRWDHAESAYQFNNNNTENAYLLAVNLVYKF